MALAPIPLKLKGWMHYQARCIPFCRIIAALRDGMLKIGAKTGTSGKIFGSVTSVQIARAIREQKGYEIDRRRITILDEVKELGTFKAKVDFGNGNETELEFEVISE